ncbi:MAG TPA: zinc ribbon domain-containing protein [Polyangia bacterium]
MSAAPTAKTKPAAAPENAAAVVSATARRRRIPGWLLAAVCAALGIAYGVVFEHMRMSPPLVMLGLGGMTLALAGMALWRVIDPLMRGEAPAATLTPRAPQRMRELEREKQIVLKSIKEIELDYQMRKIAEADYRDMIGRYRARAMRLISELEAGDNYRQLIERELKDRLHALAEAGADAPRATAPAPSSEAVPATATAATTATASPNTARCAACGTINDNDAHFCKTCGVRLDSAS